MYPSVSVVLRFGCSLLLLVGLTGAVRAAEPFSAVRLEVSPAEVSLRHDDDSAQLLVTAVAASGARRDVTHDAAYVVSGAPAPIASVTAGRITPRADGEGEVRIAWSDPATGQSLAASAQVRVSDLAIPRPLDFTRDVTPLLSKLSCNSGGCHGKAIGQNGFRLSLFGFDPQFDYVALVHEGRGRRVSPAAPDDSLLLRKGSGGIAHGGGVRMGVEDEAYRLLLRWVAQGTPWGADDAPAAVRLEITPDRRLVSGAERQQLRVVAHYADGSSRDVTRVARYDSQQPDIVEVTPHGLLEATGAPGEGYVMIRYGDLVGTASVTLPRGAPLGDEAYAGFVPRNYIDEHVLAKWRALHIAPSPVASDEAFVRRAHLALIGALPTPDEVRAFLDDDASDKRDKLIDALLDRPAYAEFWAHRWGQILRNRVGDSNAKDNTLAFHQWIQTSLAENKPYDRFVREILTASGKRSDQPQMDWYRQAITHSVRVQDASQAFLGMRVSCANCHNHPFENISQTDYWRFAAFFAKVGSVTYGSVDEIKYKEDGVVKHPRSEQPLAPKAFQGPEFTYEKDVDPRHQLVDWMADSENPYFAKALVNRLWGHLFGVGLVDPVDDLRATNPPSNPELLDALARDFVAQRFDLKHVLRTIMQSRVYQLSALPTEANAHDTRNFARHYPQRLSPHVLLDAINDVTGTQVKFDDYPDIARAVRLPNERGRSEFLDMFGRSPRDTPCECETSLAPNLGQVLYLLHSDELERKLAAKEGTVTRLVDGDQTDAEIVEELFLLAFARRPTADEARDAAALIAAGQQRRQVVEDLLWTLLNAKEFLFTH
jgi:hypothetical protein